VRPILSVFLSWLSLTTIPLTAQRPPRDQACLHAFADGGRVVTARPCGDADPLAVSKNADVAKVMQALNIRSNSVLFRGCNDGRFSTSEEPLTGSPMATPRYAITYPTGPSTGLLAPITHELAHVLQIRVAGGLTPLQESLDSKHIELEADFLTGIVFSFALRDAGLSEFQHNLALMGRYVDSPTDAHGSPVERTSAFRRGVFFDFARVGMDFSRASAYFQANIYGELVAIP
jgi:hypothetical protein